MAEGYIEQLLRAQVEQQVRDELAATQEAARLAQEAMEAELANLARLAGEK